jgi:anthranilate synthase component 1
MHIGSPRVQRLNLNNNPAELFYRMYEKHDDCFLLESIGKGRLSNFSFIGFSPVLTVKLKDSAATISYKNREERYLNISDPFDFLRRLVPLRQGLPKEAFFGGLVGYISYDSVFYWEQAETMQKKPSQFPDMEFGLYLDWVAFDHRDNSAFYITFGEDRKNSVIESTNDELELGRLEFHGEESSVSDEEFKESVVRAKEYINKGDIFQVVLSRRYTYTFKGDTRSVYNSLRKVNPSPYMFFLKFHGKEVFGSSPEMLVKVQDRTVETYPIAGTRRRSKNLAEDYKLRKELLSDEKERAEHVMLVDLARNDIGKVSKFGSVKVKNFLQVKRYSHVQHLVSHVTGELDNRFDSFDALKATFPAGTVTGAPKPRAIEIIEEMERVARGPYGGAVGYFSFNGNADFGITIRSFFTFMQSIYMQAGAGIVADSKPEDECEEVRSKLRALVEALTIARSVQE